MDSNTLLRGLHYEALMMRAFKLRHSDVNAGADRRIFYLLFHIRQGMDLRQTGYATQLLSVRNNIEKALKMMLEDKLHQHEEIGLQRLLQALDISYSEKHLGNIVEKALKVSLRLQWEIDNSGK